jgi:SAM-dependent methyltransferase
VAEATGLAPGRALDAGCGAGADAVWLARRGWWVTAVDVAPTALLRGQEAAALEGEDVASRIAWVEADLMAWTPPGRYDLVQSQYAHPADDEGVEVVDRHAWLDRLADAVALGGTLLVVTHDPTDEVSSRGHASPHQVQLAPEDVVVRLPSERWSVEVAEVRARPVVHDGRELSLRDAVVRARRIAGSPAR